MKTNIDVVALDRIKKTATEIRDWLTYISRPENYTSVKDSQKVINFVHSLDLLETVLIRFEIQTHMAKLALTEMKASKGSGTMSDDFWLIDIEETFASTILELGYQIKNAWKTLSYYSKNDIAFSIFKKSYEEPSDIFLARHKATHFQPENFLSHPISSKNSILRRPYSVINGMITKELAKDTMPKVAHLIRNSFEAGDSYLQIFHCATVGNENN